MTVGVAKHELTGVIGRGSNRRPRIERRKLSLEEPVRRRGRRATIAAIKVQVGESGGFAQDLPKDCELICINILRRRLPTRSELRKHILKIWDRRNSSLAASGVLINNSCQLCPRLEVRHPRFRIE